MWPEDLGSGVVRLSKFVRTECVGEFRQVEPWLINLDPTRFSNWTCPNVKFGHKICVQTRFFRVRQIRVFGSDSFLPTLIKIYSYLACPSCYWLWILTHWITMKKTLSYRHLSLSQLFPILHILKLMSINKLLRKPMQGSKHIHESKRMSTLHMRLHSFISNSLNLGAWIHISRKLNRDLGLCSYLNLNWKR